MHIHIQNIDLLPQIEKQGLDYFCHDLQQHYTNLQLQNLHIFATSGTTGLPKFLSIPEQNLIGIGKTFQDRFSPKHWLNTLPNFHVSGIMPAYRCPQVTTSSQCKIHNHKQAPWSAESFVQELYSTGADWTALVPYQLEKILDLHTPPPPALQGILVSGGAIPSSLLHKSLEQQWPIIVGFGATETCGSFAFSDFRNPNYPKHFDTIKMFPKIHPNIPDTPIMLHTLTRFTVSLEPEYKTLIVHSPYIATNQCVYTDTWNCTLLHNIQTQDLAKLISPTQFIWQGRNNDIIKYKGEFINIGLLKIALQPHMVVYQILTIDNQLVAIVDNKKKSAQVWALLYPTVLWPNGLYKQLQFENKDFFDMQTPPKRSSWKEPG
jgi:acyl-CoA synthetase (AMP-forming)/AMP-acid ligase II